jgi:hypothetical protein
LGLAILTYEDWFEHRQDAWVARPGPTTLDSEGNARLYLVEFAGAAGDPGTDGMAGTSGVEGLSIDRDCLPFLINTGAEGKLSHNGRLETLEEHLPEMADRVRLTPEEEGSRDVVLYAHGGLVSEVCAAETSSRLWRFCRSRKLSAYFFIWETGWFETLLGMLRSSDDVAGPPATFDVNRIERGLEEVYEKARESAFRAFGTEMAGLAGAAWAEMKKRAVAAAEPKTKNFPGGGAALFVEQLFAAMGREKSTTPFRIHLFGHSAGSILLAHLYEKSLRHKLQKAKPRVELGTIQLFAPAITIGSAKKIFFGGSEHRRVVPSRFLVYTLNAKQEEDDWIGIYPTSLLKYVAEYLEFCSEHPKYFTNHPEARKPAEIPLLGIREHFNKASWPRARPTLREAEISTRHSDFDDAHHEIEVALEALGKKRAPER